MLGRKIFVLHLLGLFLSFLKDRVRARAEILLTAAHLWKLFDSSAHLGCDGLCIRPDLSKDRFQDALLLLKHCRENVFRLDLLILVLFRYRDRFLNSFLAADG